MKKIIVLGSTGSLGCQTLELLEKYKNEFKLIGICAKDNRNLLEEQAGKFKVEKRNAILTSKNGDEALLKLAEKEDADIVVNVLSGVVGVAASTAALRGGKTLLLGNKESVVLEGEYLMKTAKKGQLLPLDSEHNAIYEIIQKFPNEKIEKIAIPCSGGPFLGKSRAELENVTIKDVLAHPKWKMGSKISVESATLINKGFEIIEAHYLFNLPLKKIDVFINPKCLIHGIVHFKNLGAVAYISEPDMKEHIENALLRAIGQAPPRREIRLLQESELNFSAPDHEIFQGIKIVLNEFKKSSQNMMKFMEKEEETVTAFLKGELSFLEIFEKLKDCL